TKPDHILAKELRKTSAAVVQRKRRRLGISHFRNRPWTAAEQDLLGRRTDRQIALELGRPERAVRERRRQRGILPFLYSPKRWTIAEEQLLGKEPDFIVAKRLKRTLTSVSAKREGFGIRPLAECRKVE